MSEHKISKMFNIQRRFLRSAHLERDFRDPSALQGYVVTRHIADNLSRISEGLSPKSGQRAWRITGDYGSGKSSFALLLAHLFAGKDSELPPQLRKVIDLSQVRKFGLRLLPVLVTGSREPLSTAIIRSLARALEDQFDARAKIKVLQEINAALRAVPVQISDDAALRLLLEANSQVIIHGKGDGLLIILDELGKFLEFAALHPERQDIFFLQQLAEAATRSSREPLFTIGLLHQGFSAYADQMSQSAQKEWEKVAGRFEELVFDQPLDQITHLIGSALNVSERLYPKGADSRAKTAMQTAAEIGWFGAAPATSSLTAAAQHLYPLHPTTIPVLVKLFSRFGQNERSLFSFLLSNEPYGLQAFSEQEARAESFYRIHNLYDYTAANFGHRLSVQSYRNHWNHIDSLVRSFPTENETEIAVLKTVGLLNLINAPGLLPTEEAIVLALAAGGHDGEQKIRASLRHLNKDRHVLYARGKSGGYCLWSHTSVNLDAAYEEAARAIGSQKKVANQIHEHLDARPVVARRHYIKTGNLRHFEVNYCGLTDLQSLIEKPLSSSDGRIIIPLCETPDEVRTATDFARSLTDRLDIIIGITDPLASLSGLLQELERWNWVERNIPELKDDRYAAEEVARQLALARHTLEKRIEHYAGLRQASRSGSMSIRWYSEGRREKVESGPDFLLLLSKICDKLYDQSPIIHNELVNRRSLSSAAASGRMRLIRGMFASGDKALLGMDAAKKPPEMSMYLSVLLESKLHRQKSGAWILQEPSEENDPCKLQPAFAHLRKLLAATPDSRIPVTSILASLRQPPFGIRDGILPILLVIALLEHEHELALYENGTFLSRVGSEEILRLSKAPHVFELQLFKIQGVRRTVFEKLTGLLGVPRSKTKAEILDVVRPLCVFVAGLPEYTRMTQRLSVNTRAARDAILQAREPAALLFKELPMAMDLPPFGTDSNAATTARSQEFLACLQAVLEELKLAYPQLKSRIRDKLLAAFEVPASTALQPFRDSLAVRCENLVVNIRDMDLKAFCLRLLDSQLPESDWIESVGSFIANSPPSRWKDDNEAQFTEKLSLLIQKFLRVESICFTAGKQTAARPAFRIAITARDGSERDRVVHLGPDQEPEAKELEKQILALIKQSNPVSITAASRVIWRLLQTDKHEQPPN
ncbi:MAG: hypothetical protein JWO95_1522 [Verrucomicrobiales bacterium]|nr:hypothetical protein [Verrucomicrobiales bacterium]